MLATPLPWLNENRTLDLLRAMAHGRFWIDEWVAPGGGGETPDKAWVELEPSSAALSLTGVAPSSAFPRGHYYCGGAPGLAFFLYPVHEVARRAVPDRLLELVLVLFGSALPLALGAVAVKRAVEHATACSVETAVFAGAIHALATIALPFGTRLYAHSLEVALIAGSLALVLRRDAPSSPLPTSPLRGEETHGGGPHRGEVTQALAGFLAACAVACDYNVATAALALFVLAFLRGGVRGAVAFSLGAVPAAAALGWYHQVCFGSPFDTPYDHHADPVTRDLVSTRYGFVVPSPRILFELVFGTMRGFLWTQPAALLGVLGLAASARAAAPREGRSLARLALSAFALILLAHASRTRDWPAGSSFGARYSIAALPFLALGYPRGIELAGRAARPILAGSFLLALVGATNDWGASMIGNLETAWLLGPRTRGLNMLLLGTGELTATARTSLLACFVLSSALPAAAILLVRSRSLGRSASAILAISLAPWIASVPFQYVTFMRGPGVVEERYREIQSADLERRIDGAWDSREARNLALIAAGRNNARLYLRALDKAVELDPRDEKIRGLRDAERKRLQGE
ncbi:hypothetical protein HY251_19260 [bacterium]|nr:hypothetical protein [bacterium]